MRNGAGHAPDSTGFGVLREDRSARRYDRLGAIATIAAHARQQDAGDMPVIGFGQRVEHRIDRGHAAALHRMIGKPEGVKATRFAHHHMAMAGRDIDLAAFDPHAFVGKDRRPFGSHFHLLGEHGDEAGRKMLRHQDRQVEILRNLGEEQVERMDPAGRGADGDDLRRFADYQIGNQKALRSADLGRLHYLIQVDRLEVHRLR